MCNKLLTFGNLLDTIRTLSGSVFKKNHFDGESIVTKDIAYGRGSREKGLYPR